MDRPNGHTLPCEGQQSEKAGQSQNPLPQQNESNLGKSSLFLEIDKVIQKFRSAYVEKIDEVIRKNPEGLEPPELERKHLELRNETRKLFEMEIRRKVGQPELLEHMESLLSQIDEYWNTSALETNKRNLIQSMVLPPLAFQLQSKQIKMGMLIDGKAQVLRNLWGEESTPFVVGLSQDGDFLYGNEVVIVQEEEAGSKFQSSTLKRVWWVAEHFVKSEGSAWRESVGLKDGTEFSISVEFLIGFIFKRLKEQLETEMGGRCPVAVVTVPFWFCSAQRLQVKVAGSLAGFTDIYLLNDASAAAFSICLRGDHLSASIFDRKDNIVLVISENGGVISATIHVCSDKNWKKLVMVSHYGTYGDGEVVLEKEKKKKSGLRKLAAGAWNMVTSTAGAQGDYDKSHDEDGMFQTVRHVCREVLKESKSVMKPNWLVISCESDEWKPVLEQIGKKCVPDPANLPGIGEENSVVLGASLLSKNPGGIGEKIRDKLALDLMRRDIYRDDDDVTGNGLISKGDLLPMTSKQKILTIFPQFTKVGVIFQRVMGEDIWVGALNLNERHSHYWSLKSHMCMEAQMEISSEGIVAMTAVGQRNWSKYEKLSASFYDWRTPNLGIEECKRAKLVLEGKSGHVSAEVDEELDRNGESKEDLEAGAVFSFQSSIEDEDSFEKLTEEASSSAKDSKTTKVEEKVEAEPQPKVLPPLVFQLQTKRIKMGMLMEEKGNPQVLKNVWGERSTPFVVGMSHDGDLLYGNDVVANIPQEGGTASISQSILKSFWWVADHFMESEDETWSEVIELKDGTRFNITVEFLLGFILKRLKEQLEMDLGVKCSVAVVTVPFWFSCSQRLQVKDGTRLAGLTDMYILNDVTAAAFSFGLLGAWKAAVATDNLILVLSENGGIISATIHAFQNMDWKKVFMVSHHGSYNSQSIAEKSKASTFRKVTVGAWISDDDDKSYYEDERFRTVRDVCIEVLRLGQVKLGNSGDTVKPHWLVITVESDEWRPILEYVGKGYVQHPTNHFRGDDAHAVLIGAALLGQHPEEIPDKIRDKLAFDLMAQRGSGSDGERCVISKDELLPMEFSAKFSRPTKKGIFFQRVMGRDIWTGWLDMGPDTPCYWSVCSNDIKIELSSEGIVLMCDDNKYDLNENKCVPPSYYKWATPNLSVEDFNQHLLILERLKIEVEKSNHVMKLTNARVKLLGNCEEFKKDLETGALSSFKSGIERDKFKKLVQDAICFAQSSSSTQDQIERQMEALRWWCSKYKK